MSRASDPLAPPAAAVAPPSADSPATRLATRLGFLVAGFGVACWAPLVPYAKARLGVDDGVLGLLILSLGLGSIAAMLGAGAASARFGARPVVVVSGFALALVLPGLAIASTPLALAAVLFCFGGALGSLDVSINIHAVEVERDARVPLMSGFHALFSVGGFLGAGVMTLLLSQGVAPVPATLPAAFLMVVAMAIAAPRLVSTRPPPGGALIALPRGPVALLAVLSAAAFLAEGALLDWSALLLTTTGLADEARGGLGYMLFSIAMTAGRFAGDRVVARLGDFATLAGGGGLAAAGFAVLLVVPVPAIAFAGFVLIGLGAANIVPVLFRRAGAQTAMPSGLAIAAVTTVGYAGSLLGPALVGFVADAFGLPASFWILALFFVGIAACAGAVTRR